MKVFFPNLQENERLKQQFGEHILRGTFAHAYLIQGASGTGKCLFAHMLAAALCCHNRRVETATLPCHECEACRKIMGDATPDLHNITRGENATIGVDAIRKIKEDMYLSPTEQERKIYIIHEAEKMTAAAQNALLIALEEPPADVVILLLCEDASSLLPTVRSRVQTMRMSLFSETALSSFLENNREAKRLKETAPNEYLDLLTAAGGSPGRALALLDKKQMHTAQTEKNIILGILQGVNNRTGYAKLYEAMTKLSTKRQELGQELTSFSLSVRDLITVKRDEDVPLCFFGDRDMAREMASAFSLRCLFTVYDAIREAQITLSQNANVNVVLTVLTSALSHAPTK